MTLRFSRTILGLLAALGPLLSPDLAAEEAVFTERAPLILAQGEQRLIRLPGLGRYSLGSDAIRLHPLGSEQLLIKGTHPGRSDLWVWKKDGSAEHRAVRVEKLEIEDSKPRLFRALSELQELEVLSSGGAVILRGEIGSVRESARVQGLLEGFPKEIINEATFSEKLLTEAQESLSAWLASSKYRHRLRLDRLNGTLILSGSIEKPSELESAARQIRSRFPATQIEISSLPDESPTIHFKVYLLELRRDRFRSLGLSWPPSQVGAFRVSSAAIQDFLQLDLTLQSLESEGQAKILSNPELVVRAPGEAELFSGGELPIRNQSQYFSNTTWKSFGLTLKLKVTHATADRVRLDIYSEVSHLDSALSEGHTPGIQANRMKTQVDAQFDSPLFLSGLLQQSMRKQVKGLPFLSQIPVLGTLFGSSDYQNERSELVAILVPRFSPPAAPLERMNFSRLQGPAAHSLPSAGSLATPPDLEAVTETPPPLTSRNSAKAEL